MFFYIFGISKGRLAQLVERLVYTEEVGGSKPSPPTILIDINLSKIFLQ